MLNITIDNRNINLQSIIELVRLEHPDRREVIAGLENSTNGHWRSKAYYQFVDSTNANQPGAEWQHDDCIVVEEIDIVIDLLKDGRIGGIEFISLLE